MTKQLNEKDFYQNDVYSVALPESHLEVSFDLAPLLATSLLTQQPTQNSYALKYPHRAANLTANKARVSFEASHQAHSPKRVELKGPKLGWCTKTGTTLPLLTKTQAAELQALYDYVGASIKAFKLATNDRLDHVPDPAHYGLVLAAYKTMLNYPLDTAALPLKGKALVQHLINHNEANAGHACDDCGVHLSSPNATMCGACGTVHHKE